MKWFLLGMLLSGPSSGPLNVSNLVGGIPEPFASQSSCELAARDINIAKRFYASYVAKGESVALICVSGWVVSE